MSINVSYVVTTVANDGRIISSPFWEIDFDSHADWMLAIGEQAAQHAETLGCGDIVSTWREIAC